MTLSKVPSELTRWDLTHLLRQSYDLQTSGLLQGSAQMSLVDRREFGVP